MFSSNSSENSEELVQAQSSKSLRKRDREECSDDERDQQHLNKKNSMRETGDSKQLLACPFFQRNPLGSCRHRSCNGPGWASIARLKEHLYRSHFVLRCRRCKFRFESASELENHYQNPTPCIRERLKCKRLQDWKQIYKTLFPDDDETSIPSQHYSTVVAITDIFDRFDRDYQHEVERLIPERLGSILVKKHSRATSAIQGDILAVISDVHHKVTQSIKQQPMSWALDDSNQISHSNDSSASASRMEPNLDNPVNYSAGYVNSLGSGGGFTQKLDANVEFDSTYWLSWVHEST
ncbi:hypothetical protein M434DRAFT_325367 [Hypoxylon sp. CO27-5]|nr:hypothetical protein M434DRAFT_325367 [Hypoxylon sp. CO27-5]